MISATHPTAPVQRTLLVVASVIAVALLLHALEFGGRKAALFVVGLCLGLVLYHAAFGFSGAYRRMIVDADMSGVSAQLLMLAAAVLLFAPVLAQGSVLGTVVGGAVAPVSVSMGFGAFLFGIGMQLGGGCASGTLYTAGGGNLRMGVVLLFFCAGAFWGSLDLAWWTALPGIGAVSLGRVIGWEAVVPVQLAALGLIYLALRRAGGENKRSLWWAGGFRLESLWRGPWPLLLGAGLLALFNWLVLLIAGHAWSITWAFSLWTAKAAVLVGWDPATSEFWSGSFQQGALARSVFADNTSLTNIGIVIGAFIAAALAGRAAGDRRLAVKPLVAAVVGGLLMGYGARLAYGCNIGSLFSGVASASLHGWVWIACAVPGNVIGVRLRPHFALKN